MSYIIETTHGKKVYTAATKARAEYELSRYARMYKPFLRIVKK